MRSIIFIISLFLSISIYAAEINCYSNKTRIYHGYGNDFTFADTFISFTENATQHIIMISADCIVIVPIQEGDDFHAISLGEKSTYA